MGINLTKQSPMDKSFEKKFDNVFYKEIFENMKLEKQKLETFFLEELTDEQKEFLDYYGFDYQLTLRMNLTKKLVRLLITYNNFIFNYL